MRLWDYTILVSVILIMVVSFVFFSGIGHQILSAIRRFLGLTPTDDDKSVPDYSIRLERDELFQQLGRAFDQRNAEDSVLWTMFGIFWGSNIGLLIALFQATKETFNMIGLTVSLFGVFISFAWHFIQQRFLGHTERYEALAHSLERCLRIPKDLAVSGWINLKTWSLMRGTYSARKVIWCCSVTIAVSWLGFLTSVALRWLNQASDGICALCGFVVATTAWVIWLFIHRWHESEKKESRDSWK